jgi:CBS domain containing-hemolysin-like protein
MLAAAGIILLLIALTGFYVAAEFAAVGVRRSRSGVCAKTGTDRRQASAHRQSRSG